MLSSICSNLSSQVLNHVVARCTLLRAIQYIFSRNLRRKFDLGLFSSPQPTLSLPSYNRVYDVPIARQTACDKWIVVDRARDIRHIHTSTVERLQCDDFAIVSPSIEI